MPRIIDWLDWNAVAIFVRSLLLLLVFDLWIGRSLRMQLKYLLSVQLITWKHFPGVARLNPQQLGCWNFFFHFSPSHLIYNIWLRGGGLLGQQSSSQFIAPTWKLNKLDPKLLINYNLFILNYNFIILIIIIENEILYERLNNIINHGFWLSGWPPPHPEGGCMGSRI